MRRRKNLADVFQLISDAASSSLTRASILRRNSKYLARAAALDYHIDLVHTFRQRNLLHRPTRPVHLQSINRSCLAQSEVQAGVRGRCETASTYDIAALLETTCRQESSRSHRIT